jgi:phage N-6-adenine-methyltransferase
MYPERSEAAVPIIRWGERRPLTPTEEALMKSVIQPDAVPAVIAPAVDEFVAVINELEAQADAAETQPSDIRWEQARQVAAALDAGMTTRQLAAEWKKSDGSSYSPIHVSYTAKTWREFVHYSVQDRPLYYAAYNSPEVRGKSAEPKGAHVANASGENEWYTPVRYLDAARKVLGGIDLDPASSDLAQRNVGAKRYFTQKHDGLKQDWSGTVWLNPPYAQPLIGQFLTKLVDAYDRGRVTSAIALTNNATETAWGNAILQAATSVCFVKGRIKFLNRDGIEEHTPLQGQMFCYLGDDRAAFERAFCEFGVIR